MRPIWVFYFLGIILLFACQRGELDQKELQLKFNSDWCECIEKRAIRSNPEEIVNAQSNFCVHQTISAYLQDDNMLENFRKLVKKKSYTPSLSEYEKYRLFGKELGKNTIMNAVDDCLAFRKVIQPYKEEYFF